MKLGGAGSGALNGEAEWKAKFTELAAALDTFVPEPIRYDHNIYRDHGRERGYGPAIARRGTRHGTGLGTYRWGIGRSFAWLHGFRRCGSDGKAEPTSRKRSSNSPAA